jgi:type IV secretion system protein VirB8
VARDRELEVYLAEAASWDRDRAAMLRLSARRAWTAAGAGWVATVLAVGALAALAPLKTVAPYVIRVDRRSGVVDVVPELRAGAKVSQVVTRYLLTHYVSICNRFDFSTAESDYQECGAFQSPRLNQAWYARWTASNPASPLNRYRDGTELTAAVRAVSFLSGTGGVDLAQVRYTVARRTPNGTVAAVVPYIATIQYTYIKPSSDPRVRQWNPLGLRVVGVETVREVAGDLTPNTHPGAGR